MMCPLSCKSKCLGQRGVALIMTLFVLVILSLLGLGLMTNTTLETKINSNARSSYPAYYAAEAGLEEATYRMKGSAINPINQTQLNAASKVVYVRQNTSIDPTSSSSPDYDTEYATSSFTTVNYYTTNQSTNPIPYRWVKISVKTKRLSGQDVNNGGISTNQDVPIYYDGAEYLYDPVNGINASKSGFQVYQLTSFARTSDGASYKVRREISSAGVPVNSAIQTLLAETMGQALNVTGYTDPVCSLPNTYGAVSGSTIITPGGGNVTGSPSGTLANTPFPYDVASMIGSLTPSASQIDAAGTGVTGSGSPVSYLGPHAVLGVKPTVIYDGSGAVTAITAPGTPVAYYSPGNLTLGTPVQAGTAVTGQGILLVNGNLTIDITNGFDYFGLILVSGNITMTANPSTSANSNIHGAIIGGGTFNSSALANLSGSVFIHQNACMVNQMLSNFISLAFKEI